MGAKLNTDLVRPLILSQKRDFAALDDECTLVEVKNAVIVHLVPGAPGSDTRTSALCSGKVDRLNAGPILIETKDLNVLDTLDG